MPRSTWPMCTKPMMRRYPPDSYNHFIKPHDKLNNDHHFISSVHNVRLTYLKASILWSMRHDLSSRKLHEVSPKLQFPKDVIRSFHRLFVADDNTLPASEYAD